MVEVEAYGVGADIVAQIDKIAGVRGTTLETVGAAQLLTVQSESDVDVQADVLAALDGVRLGRVSARQPTLEDAYVAIVSGMTRAEGDRKTVAA